jgi:hypothetical protein
VLNTTLYILQSINFSFLLEHDLLAGQWRGLAPGPVGGLNATLLKE